MFRILSPIFSAFPSLNLRSRTRYDLSTIFRQQVMMKTPSPDIFMPQARVVGFPPKRVMEMEVPGPGREALNGKKGETDSGREKDRQVLKTKGV